MIGCLIDTKSYSDDLNHISESDFGSKCESMSNDRFI